jgi:hypothetical protein
MRIYKKSCFLAIAGIVLLFVSSGLAVSGQQDIDYYQKEYIRFTDHIYKDNIKTVLFHRAGWELTPPVIHLNTDEHLQLSFDDLDGDVKNYLYTIVHCDANWSPSALLPNEYLEGYTEDRIEDYKFSFNTIQTYTHYDLILPNRDINYFLSGNYLLKVYDTDSSDMVLTMRFMVVNPKVSVTGHVRRASNVEERNYQQEIDFSINTKDYPIYEPYRSLNVIIMQNNRWDNSIINLKPKMVVGDDLDYNYDAENVFDGGNEFRNVDIKSLHYQSQHIKAFGYENRTNHVYLWEDEPRSFKVYHSEEDINGNHLISCEDADDVSIECDYAWIHFSLHYPALLTGGNLYVYGALTNWQFINEGKMIYDPGKKEFCDSLYLKEGYYDYLYLFVENGTTRGDSGMIEGNHYETGNDYSIYVYYRSPGYLYDELIGIKTLNPRENP